MDRNFKALKAADPAPYYISYSVQHITEENIAAASGTLLQSNKTDNRFLDISVRAGSPDLDNYRRVRGDWPQFTSTAMLPLDDNAAAIRRRLWLDTDRTYRAASQRLLQIKANQQSKVASDDSKDFSIEDPVIAYKIPANVSYSAEEWTNRIRRASARFATRPSVLASSVRFSANRTVKYLVSTDGVRLAHGRHFFRVSLLARAKASDGMDLSVTESFDAMDPAGLPSQKVLNDTADRLATELEALLRAPAVDPFVGPAILSGRASGVFFHEIFGHRIEGHRQKDDTEGQTFTKSVNSPVLPDFLSVKFDPTIRQSNGVDLNGYYDYDDEGIPGRPVVSVENGVLKTFLLSRTPVPGFAKSNGHGRRQVGAEIASRQSNLIVESSRTFPEDELRGKLREELKRQNKPYGLYFKEVTGGYTTTGRRGLQAYTVIPLVVYRVFADSAKPDELVRGADIVGTPLTSFSKIVATGNKTEIFNGFCGAESGSVPVSAVSPAILISEIEIQRKDQSRERPPLLPRPVDRTEGAQ